MSWRDRKTKPSNRRLVLNTKLNKWMTPEEEQAHAELEKQKQEQAQKILEEDDEPHPPEEKIE